ncbi:MAG TPA: Gfo/Idh/MocA family oxidoreductase [Vicinamibacterales bacterium]|nr:Gfo/Idh/MocA family oxidoreductase [Vicinamibacterales bacterium]
MRTLGVGVVGIGWCAKQHISAFRKNPRCKVIALCGRDEARVRANLERDGLNRPDARITTRYEDLLEDPAIDIISIATPNHLHASQAVAAARAGKHILLEKPTGLDEAELVAIRDAVREAGVRTIVSFELRYNPYLRFVHWMRESGRLGRIRFARVQYLSRVTDWYAGWEWVRTRESGRSHLLAAGCHAVDALRWLSGLEPVEVSARHAHFTEGYEWPTTILANLVLEGGALGHVTSSTDFMLPYTFGVELMGDRATIRDTLLAWGPADPIDLDELRAENPIDGVTLHPAAYGSASPAIRIESAVMPDTADVAHHPFQAEIDDLVECVLAGRDPNLNVFDAQKTMEVCLAADRSAERNGEPVRLPLIPAPATSPVHTG